MSLPSLQIDAFLALARKGSFSQAARSLHITQSALSQRIAALESQLERTLFQRVRLGVRMTSVGEEFLRFAQEREAMENESLKSILNQQSNELSGALRIGFYSSIGRSVVLPALASFLRQHSKVECEFLCRRVDDLPGLLSRSEVDLIIMDRLWQRAAIESNILGEEKYVVIESTKLGNRAPTFLDNDPEDMATEFFFYQQKRDRPIYRRGFFHDCYGILDAVSEGLGSAVMPQHLIRGRRDIKVSDAYKPVKVPVVLYNYKQAFTTKLQRAVVAELRRSSPKFLAIKDGH